MRSTARILVPAAVAALSLPLLAQAINLRPGRYESVVEMEMPGGVKVPIKSTECLTAADLKDVSKTFLEDLGEDCKISNLKNTGSRMTFTATCKDEDVTSTMTADMTFSGDAYAAKVLSKDGKGQSINVTMSGKRLGNCAPDAR